MKTYATSIKEVERQWHVIDASGKALGRLASQAARLLMGKHKPMYAPYIDTGDYVIVLNAAKVRLTGNKAKEKVYYRHSGYPGGLKVRSFENMMAKHPTRVVEIAVKGMLPHNSLGSAMYRKLKVYAGDSHPHQAQLAKSAAKGSES